jgi:biopolymer transport protein TolR
MARRTSLTSLKQISEINLTPLMDLTFILLITFIITFPLIEHGVQVNLPVGKASPVEAADTQTISLDAAGALFLNDRALSLDELRVAMASVALADAEAPVMVRADQSIAYGKVMVVLRLLHDAGLHRLALVTREE